MTAARFDNFTIVLQKPKFPGNIGSVARCIKNMGMGKLIVSEAGPFDPDEMKIMSTHFAADIVDNIQYYDRLGDALAPFQYIVGTTSRLGSARGPALSPRETAESLVGLSQNNEIALLFGSEDKGLSNSDLRYCHAVTTIPVSEKLKSINLSHAVMILCYEVFAAGGEKKKSLYVKAGVIDGNRGYVRPGQGGPDGSRFSQSPESRLLADAYPPVAVPDGTFRKGCEDYPGDLPPGAVGR